jgi:UDP-N-acetylglucosamine diphosphorylase/glucosamine-1-phosphate N-acetyltransferase
LTEPYLQVKFKLRATDDNVFLSGAICPTENMVEAVQQLQIGEVLVFENTVIAYRSPFEVVSPLSELKIVQFEEKPVIINRVWDIFVENATQIGLDLAQIKKSRASQPITDRHTQCYAPENVFVEEGASIKAAVLNAENGPIYIGKNAVVSEGAIIIGPFALGDDSTVNWGAKMRANISIGPHCKVGGEVANTVFFGHSNKGHDGFIGNSVIGEWCNLGANTNGSNLKNDYTNVKIYDYASHSLEDTGRLFCGLFMGDYTKAGISTMFNTGTVVGVNANVFGAGFQPKHIPSFSWGGAAEGLTEYRVEKAIEVARQTVSRRGMELSEADQDIMRQVFEMTRG